MTFQELELIIEGFAKSSEIDKDEIIKDLAVYAKLRFGNLVTAIDRKLIDAVKIKIVDGYYNMPGHSYVTNRPDFRDKFGFDDLEMKVLLS